MKRSFRLVFCMSLLLVSFVSAYDVSVTSTSQYATSLAITAIRYEPYPVIPGEKFDLWAKVEARGISLKNITCNIEPNYPFSIYEDSSTKSYGQLNSGDSVVFKFRLKADQQAVDGDNELELRCSSYPYAGSWQVQKINISIQTRYPTMNIINVKTIPETIAPGEQAKISFNLENQADSPMKDISIKLELANVNIAPFGEVAEKNLKFLQPGETSDISFTIKSMPNIEGGIYKIPFTLSYTDNLANQYNQTGFISLEISSHPKLLASIDSTSLSKSNKIGEINLKIVNSGLTNIKFATVYLQTSKDFKLLSADNIYVGDIDSDDFGTANFKLSMKSSETILSVKMTYRDSLNQEYSESFNLPLSLLTDKELGKSTSIWTVLIGIIFILVLVFIFVPSFRARVMGLIINTKSI